MGRAPFEVPGRCPLAACGHIRPAGRAREAGGQQWALTRRLPVSEASRRSPYTPALPQKFAPPSKRRGGPGRKAGRGAREPLAEGRPAPPGPPRLALLSLPVHPKARSDVVEGPPRATAPVQLPRSLPAARRCARQVYVSQVALTSPSGAASGRVPSPHGVGKCH